MFILPWELQFNPGRSLSPSSQHCSSWQSLMTSTRVLFPQCKGRSCLSPLVLVPRKQGLSQQLAQLLWSEQSSKFVLFCFVFYPYCSSRGLLSSHHLITIHFRAWVGFTSPNFRPTDLKTTARRKNKGHFSTHGSLLDSIITFSPIVERDSKRNDTRRGWCQCLHPK